MIGDERLCELAQCGDEKAAGALLARREKWIAYCASTWKIAGFDYGDIFSFAQMAALQAVMTFDANSGASFVTYVSSVISHAIQNQKRLAAKGAVHLSSPICSYPSYRLEEIGEEIQQPPSSTAAGELAMDHVETQRLLTDIAALLCSSGKSPQSSHALEALALMMEGYTAHEIAGALGINASVVHRIRSRASKRLSALMDESAQEERQGE
jgi:RNA polymerase sigma factor (sigma-70 family)